MTKGQVLTVIVLGLLFGGATLGTFTIKKTSKGWLATCVVGMIIVGSIGLVATIVAFAWLGLQ